MNVPTTDAKEDDDGEEEDLFDFGKAKMEFFKQRARQILTDQYEVNYIAQDPDAEYAYEGQPLPLKMCYQQLKNLIKRPAANYGSAKDKPGYMKMTFAMSRSCAPNSKILQLSSMMGNLEKLKGNDSSQMLGGKKLDPSLSSELTLLRQLKNNGSEFSLKAGSLMNTQATKKTKREEAIDKKIEKLLETYKRKDEQATNKAKNMDADKAMNRRNLLDKYGFSDDEDLKDFNIKI